VPPLSRPTPRPASPVGLGCDDLAERLAATANLTRRFRVLREGLAGTRRGSLPELREIMTTFPEGWPRRRALQTLLRAGLPAQALIAELPPEARLWFRPHSRT
jgi:hypothetical protein